MEERFEWRRLVGLGTSPLGCLLRVGEEWLPVAGRGPAGTLCSRLMGMETVSRQTSRGEANGGGRGELLHTALGRTGLHRAVSGGHAATMEFPLLQTTGGRRSIEAAMLVTMRPQQGTVGLNGEGGDIFPPLVPGRW